MVVADVYNVDIVNAICEVNDMATKADENAQNNVVENDEIGQEIKAKQIESINKELQHFKQQFDDVEQLEARFKRLWDVDKRIFEIRLEPGACEKVESQRQFKYESHPEFWNLIRERTQAEYESECARAEGTLEKFVYQKAKLKEQIDSSLSKLKELEGESQ
jgi:hypothetical protein